MSKPPLKFLHPEKNLLKLKLEQFDRLTTQKLIDSLRPGEEQPLTTKPDGTVLEGHHRLKILSGRGINIHDLPREILEEDS